MITEPVEEIISLKKPPATKSHHPDAVFVVLACLLLALLQMGWAGYRLGVGNQGIQIAFLEKLHNPALFTSDIMVQKTLSQYPSWFFWLVAPLLSLATLPNLYIVLHLLATTGMFLAVVALSRSTTDSAHRDYWPALVTIFFLLAGHHPALAGETLYSLGFTHTWAVFPLTLLTLAFFFNERYWASFALAGIIFNFHALEAGYLVAVLGFVALCHIRQIGVRKLLGMANLFILLAAPTLILLLRAHEGSFGQGQWLNLMYLRSADHSFPSSWWQPGSPEIPRFVAIIALAAVALGFSADAAKRRKLLLFTLGIAMLFAVGYLFTEVWPVPLVIRAQMFRSSRLLLILALVVIGQGCLAAWRLPFRRPAKMPAWHAWMEFASAGLTAITLAMPSTWPLLPYALLLAALVAILNCRLGWHQAMVTAAALLVCLAACLRLQYMIPGITSGMTWGSVFGFQAPSALGWLLLLIGLLFFVLAHRRFTGWGRAWLTLVGVSAALLLTLVILPNLRAATGSDQDWVNAQLWARDHSKPDDKFLTPSQTSGFRIYSQRAVVGEFRDGTQLYFAPAFTAPWWETMQALQPTIAMSSDKHSFTNPGRRLDDLDDDALRDLAQRFKAKYIVLRTSNTRRLASEYQNDTWTIYSLAAPKVVLPQFTQTGYIAQVAVPAIEKIRKSDARIQLVDAMGRPLTGVHYTLTQKSSAVGFGCSLPFFKSPSLDFGADYKSPPVAPAQLDRFLETFNYSVIPFSAQWAFMEPQAGNPDFADLDQYVDWCIKNHVRVELSSLAGIQPVWLNGKAKKTQATLTVARARQLIERYGSKIDSWQVIADMTSSWQADPNRPGELLPITLFTELRKLSGNLRLGIADDTRFWSARVGPGHDADLQRGLDAVHVLKEKGIKLDFFSLEARQPLGLWADPKEIYATLDTFAKEGVRLHITQIGVPVGQRIEGPIHPGTWTPQLQAQYYEQLFIVCYSHPNVDVINLFALAAKSWLPGEGLLDDNDKPTPALLALQDLITRKWRTTVTGSFDQGGNAAFRGFQGEYEMAVQIAGGKTLTVPLSVLPGQSNSYRFQLDPSRTRITETH